MKKEMEIEEQDVKRDELLYKAICSAVTMIDSIDKMINTHGEAQQIVDQEISDWLHIIENNELNEEQSTKVVARLRNLRKKRRSLLKEREIERVYKENASKMMGNNTRGMLIAEINKTIKQLESEYKNRVITEEDIKEVLEPTKRRVGRPKKSEVVGE